MLAASACLLACHSASLPVCSAARHCHCPGSGSGSGCGLSSSIGACVSAYSPLAKYFFLHFPFGLRAL